MAPGTTATGKTGRPAGMFRGIREKDAAGFTRGPSMSDRQFRQFGEFIHRHAGIKLPRDKKTMLEGRLQKRMRALGLESFGSYADYLFSPEGMTDELILMIDAVTTNKTEFFREPAHFDYLTAFALPTLLGERAPGDDGIRIWSAGCSTGEEPYTLAMVLHDYALRLDPVRFSILATDICTKVLEKARRGIYDGERIDPIPLHMRRNYLLRSKDRSLNLFRVSPLLRQHVQFRRLNFMDDDFGIAGLMDIIFCRNVIIYFDRETQARLLRRFCDHLRPGGFLFLGHSETLSGIDVPLVQVASTTYRKPA